MNSFSPHIPFAELADLADGHPTSSAEALEHLSLCSTCATQLETLRQTITLMKSDLAEDVPAGLIADAKGLFRAHSMNQQPSLLARVIAELTFDSLTTAPAFGLRSAANTGRQLIYSTDQADIDLRIAQEDDGWTVAGQVLGSDCVSAEVKLESDDFSASAELSELCEFSFRSVPDGAYKIVVQLQHSVVETPQLELRL
jgi:hypothetical protein